MTVHLFSTCRDGDHTPSESACRLATLELLERKLVTEVAQFAEELGVVDRRDPVDGNHWGDPLFTVEEHRHLRAVR